MLVIVGSILLARFVAPAPWGVVLVGCAIVWEIAEKVFWFRYSKRIPIAVGRRSDDRVAGHGPLALSA